MPATRVTIASNSKQSQKAPLLISASTSFEPRDSPSCCSLVIKTAQSKLRLKKASRVFVHGGRELTQEEDWKEVLKDDVVLLVSAGEEYIGARTDNSLPNTAAGQDNADVNPNCPVEVLAESAFVDSLSITQLETTARTLPGIIHAVGQPDLHPGTKFPIGSVFVSKGWIHPPLIGSDIGCGMAWYKTRLSRSQVEGDKGRKIAEKLRGLEGAWRTQDVRGVWLETDEGGSSSAGEEWDAALGTVGAGNHFAEIQVVEESIMKDKSTGVDPQHELYEGEVVLLVHSGSRGYGSHILKHFTKDGGCTSLREDEPIAKEYLEAHDRACAWASRNRDLIALRFLSCLEPGDDAWDLGINAPNAGDETQADAVRSAREAVQSRKVVDIHHNNVELTSWPPASPHSTDPSPHQTNTLPTNHPAPSPASAPVFIHRKGAAPTHFPSPYPHPSTSTPLTILPLPGSRATPTLILHPTFTPHNAFGLLNALSLAHGAGRALSRAKAATYVAEKYKGRSEDLLRGDWVKSDQKGNKIVNGVRGGAAPSGSDREDEAAEQERRGRQIQGGCWVVCDEKQLVWEEAAEAYKDVWDVGGDLVRRGCAERWGWCRGRVSYKVRRE